MEKIRINYWTPATSAILRVAEDKSIAAHMLDQLLDDMPEPTRGLVQAVIPSRPTKRRKAEALAMAAYAEAGDFGLWALWQTLRRAAEIAAA